MVHQQLHAGGDGRGGGGRGGGGGEEEEKENFYYLMFLTIHSIPSCSPSPVFAEHDCTTRHTPYARHTPPHNHHHDHHPTCICTLLSLIIGSMSASDSSSGDLRITQSREKSNGFCVMN